MQLATRPHYGSKALLESHHSLFHDGGDDGGVGACDACGACGASCWNHRRISMACAACFRAIRH
jgi:heterodisulfide reductase subunit C